MADEVEPGKEAEAQREAPPPMDVEPRAKPSPPKSAMDRPSWSWPLLTLALAAVLLSVGGIFALSGPKPDTLDLGFGLLLWGLLDLLAQRRGLVAWKGPKAALGNMVNLVRGLALLALGLWFGMSATGLLKAVNPAVVVWTLVSLATFYLAAAMLLEMLVKGLRLGGQAFLLAALVFMSFSYYYFSIPFTYSWAAVLAFFAFAFAAAALHRGALAESPFLSLAALAALLILGAPLLVFSYQQSFVLEEQPLFTPTLLVPRMRQVLTGLSPQASQVLWAPVHTQAGQPGDVLFSDKVAFIDKDGGRAYVKLFQQHENGLREELRVVVHAGARLTAFSTDGSRLAYSDTGAGKSSPSLYALEPGAGPPVPSVVSSTVQAQTLPIPFSIRHLVPWLGQKWRDWTGPGPAPALRIPFSFRHLVPWLGQTWRDWNSPGQAVTHIPFSFKRFGPWLRQTWLAWRAPALRLVDRRPLAYHSSLLFAAAAPGPGHGQVWRSLGRQLYFAAPAGGPRNPASAVWRYDFSVNRAEKLKPGRSLPALSADGRRLLSVGFVPRRRYLEIADARRNDYGDDVPTHARPFDAARETRYFPAWNAAQTEVLHLDKSGSGLMIMNANGSKRRPFAATELDSSDWKTSAQEPFFLRWKEIGDTYSVYNSRPDGRGETLVYRTEARDISPPQWSADGKRVAFIVRRQGMSKVYTVGADGTWPRDFFATPDALDELKWSPDNLRLAWICRRSGGAEEIWTADYRGLSPVKVHSDAGHIQDLTWSPRGKHLAVQQTRIWTFLGLRIVKPDLRTVLMVDLVDNHARVMTRFGLMSWDPAFSPHGEAIAYFTDSKPWAVAPLRKRSTSLVVSQLY